MSDTKDTEREAAALLAASPEFIKKLRQSLGDRAGDLFWYEEKDLRHIREALIEAAS